MYFDYNKAKPTTILGFPWLSLNQTKIKGNYFVALGDSFTSGYALQYPQSWPSVLSSLCGIDHINLAFTGSSIDAMNQKYHLSKKINNHALHIHVLSYPWRSTRNIKFLGDKYNRVRYKRNMSIKDYTEKLKYTLEKFKDDNIFFSNVWGYPNELNIACRYFEKKYPKFIFNNLDMIDQTDDGHAGPISQEKLAQKLYDRIF